MPKNKDPAVLFYTSDFLVGVMCLTMEERGQYITLLCLQHQRGHLTKKEMELAVGKVSPDVMAKFTEDADGKYYNEVMDGAIRDRENYLERQRANGSKGGRPKTQNEPDKNPRDNPRDNPNINPNKSTRVENENENKNINVNSTSNNSFSFSNTTTTTTICDNAQVRESEIVYKSADGDITADMLAEMRRDNALRKEIEDYFYANGYISNPELFISYNAGRGWRGHNSIDIRENGAWMKYADEWENKERRKANGGYIG